MIFLENLKMQRNNILLILIFIVFYSFFLDRFPTAQMDEPWYANTAYNFAEGNGFTNTLVGYRGGDVFVLYTFITGIFFKVFNCTLFITRLVSIIGGIIAAIYVLKISDKLNLKQPEKYLIFTAFTFGNVFYIIFRSGRPEGWIITFGIITIYYMLKLIAKKQRSTFLYLSLFSACAFLVHPNGVLFLINAYILVVIELSKQKKIKEIFVFIISNVLFIAIPFIFVFSDPSKLEEFLIQAQHRNAISDENKSIIENLTTFVNSYVLGIKRLYILVFEIGLLLLAFVFGKSKNIKYISGFGLLNFLISMVIFNPYISRSFSQIIIFSIVSMILITSALSHQKMIYKGIMVLFVFYTLNNFVGDLYVLYQNKNNTSYAQLANKLTSEIKNLDDQTTIAGNIEFWYPFKDSRFFNSFTNFTYKEYPSIDHLIESKEIDYIVLGSFKLEGKSPTVGREELIPKDVQIFYEKMMNYTSERGKLVEKFNAKQYGEISIWTLSD